MGCSQMWICPQPIEKFLESLILLHYMNGYFSGFNSTFRTVKMISYIGFD
jgi:hypothetical protein